MLFRVLNDDSLMDKTFLNHALAIRIVIAAALLMLGACASPERAPTRADAAPSPPNPPSTEKLAPLGPELGLEARVVLGLMMDNGPELPAAPSLRPRYVSKAAFLADLNAVHPTFEVLLDDKSVWSGFGPGARYRTNADGSITR